MDSGDFLALNLMANFGKYLNQDVDKWVAFVGLNSMHYQIPFDSVIKVVGVSLEFHWPEIAEHFAGDT